MAMNAASGIAEKLGVSTTRLGAAEDAAFESLVGDGSLSDVVDTDGVDGISNEEKAAFSEKLANKMLEHMDGMEVDEDTRMALVDFCANCLEVELEEEAEEVVGEPVDMSSVMTRGADGGSPFSSLLSAYTSDEAQDGPSEMSNL